MMLVKSKVPGVMVSMRNGPAKFLSQPGSSLDAELVNPALLEAIQDGEYADTLETTAGGSGFDPGGESVSDVLSYLKTASPEEVARVQVLEASTDRHSKRIAAFQPEPDQGDAEGDEGFAEPALTAVDAK